MKPAKISRPNLNQSGFQKWQDKSPLFTCSNLSMLTRVRPRFFDQLGHETMYASCGNKHFFTKSCHRQTYQNYEQPP